MIARESLYLKEYEIPDYPMGSCRILQYVKACEAAEFGRQPC